MRFYSGFSLKNDRHFFDTYLNNSEYSVAGFSYGAIKAFNYVVEQLESSNRIDTLQLFSPAFFQTKLLKFKRLQTLSYSKNQEGYLKNFIKSSFQPYEQKDFEHTFHNLSELEELLNYEWVISDLMELTQKGVKIEVYLGGKDKIIDVQQAREFFMNVATVTYIKDANHFLQID